MNRLELTILRNLVHNDEYMRKVMPFLKGDYFTDISDKSTFVLIQEYIEKYNRPPTVEALEIALQNTNINEEQFKETNAVLGELRHYEKPENNWLVDETEKF